MVTKALKIIQFFTLSTGVTNYILFTARRRWKVDVCVYIACAVCVRVMFNNYFYKFAGVRFLDMAR